MLDLKRFLKMEDQKKKIQKALRKSNGKASVDEVLSLYIVMILGNHKLNDHVFIQMTSKVNLLSFLPGQVSHFDSNYFLAAGTLKKTGGCFNLRWFFWHISLVFSFHLVT